LRCSCRSVYNLRYFGSGMVIKHVIQADEPSIPQPEYSAVSTCLSLFRSPSKLQSLSLVFFLLFHSPYTLSLFSSFSFSSPFQSLCLGQLALSLILSFSFLAFLALPVLTNLTFFPTFFHLQNSFLYCNLLHIFSFTRLFYSFQCTYLHSYCSNFIFKNVCSKVV
jgi:hypothetical protein